MNAMSSDISIHNLYKRQNLPAIHREINEIFETIAMRIHEEHTAGRSELKYDLPDTFAIDNYELADLQLIIYSALIKKIEDKGLTVKYGSNKDRTSYLRIRWPSILDPSEKEKMKNIIFAHLDN